MQWGFESSYAHAFHLLKESLHGEGVRLRWRCNSRRSRSYLRRDPLQGSHIQAQEQEKPLLQ